MNLIKKNLVLVIVLAVTILLAIGLLYLVSRKYGDMKKSLAEVQKLRDEINELNKKEPAPLQENIDRIHADYLMAAAKTKEVQQLFGQPYHRALTAFAAELDLADANELRNQWQAYRRKEGPRAASGRLNQTFQKFLGEFERDKVERAFLEFKREAESQSVEAFTEANLMDIVLEALGHPRTMSPEACKTYIREMQAALMQSFRPEAEGVHAVVLGGDVNKFTFADYDDRMPLRADVPYIVKNWKMIEDVAWRLRKSQINQWGGIQRREALKGREEGDYLYLPYQIDLEGTMEAIQNFINSLQDAHHDHRIYIVREIELVKDIDEIAEATAEATATAATPPPQRQHPEEMMVPGTALPPEQFVIGRRRNVKAKIVFDYVIFIGEETRGD